MIAGDVTKTIEINGEKWAIGLQWGKADSIDDALENGRRRAKQLKAPLFVVRTQGAPQFGVVSRGSKTKIGTQAAAAAVAANLVRRFSGQSQGLLAFKVPGGYWLLVIRDDNINPDGDQFFQDSEDAQAAFRDQAARNKRWSMICAPAEWQEPEVEEGDIERELRGLTGPIIKSTSGLAQHRQKLIFGLLGVVLVGGITIDQMRKSQQAAELRAQAAARQKNQRVSIDEFDRPWNKAPAPSAVLQDCTDRIENAFKPMMGWSVADIICTRFQTKIIYFRDTSGGLLEHLLPEIRQQGSILVADSGRRVEVDIPHQSTLEVRAFQERLLEPDALRTAITSELQIGMAEISISDYSATDANKKNLGAIGGTSMNVRTRVRPMEWAGLFDAFPGITISTVSLTPASMQWTIVGAVYDNRYYPAELKRLEAARGIFR